MVSDYLVEELRHNLAKPRFRLSREAQNAIIADCLQYAEIEMSVPPSGVFCRDPDDVPILDLAIWAGVSALVTLDSDLLDLDGEFTFRIVRPAGLRQLLQADQEGK